MKEEKSKDLLLQDFITVSGSFKMSENSKQNKQSDVYPLNRCSGTLLKAME